MRVKLKAPESEYVLRVGNVYKVKGGASARDGNLMVLTAITKSKCVMLIIDNKGEITSSANYCSHSIASRVPIGFVPEIENLELTLLHQ